MFLVLDVLVTSFIMCNNQAKRAKHVTSDFGGITAQGILLKNTYVEASTLSIPYTACKKWKCRTWMQPTNQREDSENVFEPIPTTKLTPFVLFSTEHQMCGVGEGGAYPRSSGSERDRSRGNLTQVFSLISPHERSCPFLSRWACEVVFDLIPDVSPHGSLSKVLISHSTENLKFAAALKGI